MNSDSRDQRRHIIHDRAKCCRMELICGGRQHTRINNKTSRESPRDNACFQASSVKVRQKARNLTGAPCLLSKLVCCVKLWLSITLSVARRARAGLPLRRGSCAAHLAPLLAPARRPAAGLVAHGAWRATAACASPARSRRSCYRRRGLYHCRAPSCKGHCGHGGGGARRAATRHIARGA